MYINAYQKSWFKALSTFAWLTVIVSVALTLANYQAPTTAAPDLTLFHMHPHFSGIFLRLWDEFSYLSLIHI